MKTVKIGNKPGLPAIVPGCMRIGGMEKADLHAWINTAMERGAHFFDHADIYGGGKCEEVFGAAVREMNISRDQFYVQTKCGIRQGFFDFSKEHILESVDKSLTRLGMDYIDYFLLHRPDTLVEPDEVAEAFTTLHKAGKVRHFGVSNQNPGQMALLNRTLPAECKILINQLQLSPTNTSMFDAGFNVNMQNPPALVRDGSVLEYCRIHDITIQAWSPFQYGFFEGVFLGSPKYASLNAEIDNLAEQYNVSSEAIVTAWILRHPAGMQCIPGTTSVSRLAGICDAYKVTLTRPEWYAIYRAAGNVLP
ncbi:MAG: aldo/keto reductase [Defluviitaleaceae bacterium]|nr:aldo/keto reductase [Defluviitaleaceae bacterium]